MYFRVEPRILRAEFDRSRVGKARNGSTVSFDSTRFDRFRFERRRNLKIKNTLLDAWSKRTASSAHLPQFAKGKMEGRSPPSRPLRRLPRARDRGHRLR